MAVDILELRTGEAVRGPAPDTAARHCLYSAIFWLIVSSLTGLMAAFQFFNPQWSADIEWISYGRMRAAYTNTAFLIFLSLGLVGAAYYYLPRLCGTQLWSERLGIFTAWLWNLLGALAVVTLLAGSSQGRELAELVWPLDVLLLVVAVMVMTNVYMTAVTGSERKLYVSVWYVLGAAVWLPLLYFVGNAVWRGGDFWDNSGYVNGVNDATLNAFYTHSFLGLWITALGTGLLYYLVPTLTKTPLYSRILAIIGFWSLAVLYGAGGHHLLLQSPTPGWIKAIATISTFLLLVPFLTVVTNIWMTMRGNWGKVYQSIALKFTMVGVVFYLLIGVEGAVQSVQIVNRHIQYTQWLPGYVQGVTFGAYTLLLMAAFYYILPLAMRRRIYSQSLAHAQFWLATAGLLFIFLSLQIAGLIQGADWANGAATAEPLAQLRPYFIARAVGLAMVLAAGVLQAANIYMTARWGRTEQEAAAESAALAAVAVET